MRLFSKFLLLAMALTAWQGVSAQGTIRGRVTDGDTGEPLMQAVVRLFQGETPKAGAYTDIDGNYTVKATPGDYQLVISYISFVDDTIDVRLGDEVIFNETVLLPEGLEDEVLIEARRNQASTATLYNKKRNAIQAIDGVSSDLIARTGDSDVAAAMQRVVGVTVEGGKYVYVRGLGDRYSKTLLNNAEIPGLDPDRNTVQMDIFPANLIDNTIVYKNFTPELPGDFSGGLVNIVTKDFPDRFQMKVSLSSSYNDQATFNDEFLTYEGGDLDFIGFDDGSRALPDFVAENGIPALRFTNRESAETVSQATRSFAENGRRMTPNLQQAPFLNTSFQFSLGNQIDIGDNPFGYFAAISYRNGNRFFEDYRVAEYNNPGPGSTGLTPQRDLVGPSTSEEVLWGAMAKLSYKPSNSLRLGLMYMHNQGSEDQVSFLTGPIPLDAPDIFYQTRGIQYDQRSLDVVQFDGKASLGKSEESATELNFIASAAFAGLQTPDLRIFNNDFTTPSGRISDPESARMYDIQLNLYVAPQRYFRDMDESQYNLKFDFTTPLSFKGREAEVAYGLAGSYKTRVFRERRFDYVLGTERDEFSGDPIPFFEEDNLGIQETTLLPSGNTRYEFAMYMRDATENRNQYDSRQVIPAAYTMVTLPLSTRLKTVAGARFEYTNLNTQNFEGVDSTLETYDVLPALVLIYSVNENMNLRGSYSRTLARPSFREFAPFARFNPVNSRTDVGNPNLERTLIDNIDLRWEWFPGVADIVSVSAFYKNFDRPIEYIQNPIAANIEFTWQNVPSAEAYGLEFELRKGLGFLAKGLTNFQVGGNLSLLQSRVDQVQEFIDASLAVDPLRAVDRPLQGQSPYAANAELAYVDPLEGWNISLSYAVFGERIAVVVRDAPNVYEQPRPLMNFSIAKRIGERLNLRFRATNLLNPAYNFVQRFGGESYGFDVQEYVFTRYTVGRTYSLGVSYDIR